MTIEGALDTIETSTALGRLGDRIRPVLQAAVGTGVRRDVATGRWLGHAAHPAVVLVPTACWTGGVTLDLLGPPGSAAASRRLLGLGVLAAAPAAFTGAADWVDTAGAEARTGTLHAALNVAATSLFASSWVARRKDRSGAGVVTALGGMAVVGASAFLGGHLSFRRGVGVDTTAFQRGPVDWSRLSTQEPSHDQGPRRGEAEGVTMVVVDGDDLPAVLEDRCTHRGAPLHEGDVVEGCVVCPWHGSRFDLETGGIRRGPATAPQPAYEVRTTAGHIEVRRDEPGSLRRPPG